MNRCLLLVVVFCFVPGHTVRADDSRNRPADPPAVLESDGVEIKSMSIIRKQAADRTKAGELSSLTLDLWLTQPDDENKSTRIYAVKLLELDPIQDDTGKAVSSPARRDAMPFLKDRWKTSRDKTARGKSGPVLSLTLDTPAKGAMKIKSLKGKAVVSVSERLKFDDLSQVVGKPLEHAKLKDFPILPATKVEDGQTTVTLRVPAEHSQIETWGVGKKDRLLAPISESISEVEGGRELIKTYQGELTQGTFLGIVLSDPSKTATYDFAFKDVELP